MRRDGHLTFTSFYFTCFIVFFSVLEMKTKLFITLFLAQVIHLGICQWIDADDIDDCPAIACTDIEMQCRFKSCRKHPEARCQKTPGCGCNTGWFVNGEQVNCIDECSYLTCPIDGCDLLTCPGFPSAICQTDVCGCNPQFYENDLLVDCGPVETNNSTVMARPRESIFGNVNGNCPFNWVGMVMQCRHRQGPNMCDQCERQGKLCCPHGCGTVCKRPM